MTFESHSKTEVTAQLELSKNAAERNSAKSGKQAKAANKKASGRVPNMRTPKKNVVLAAAVVLASLSFFSGRFGFSSEKVQVRSASA